MLVHVSLASGRSVSIEIPADSSIQELQQQACTQLGVQGVILVNASGQVLQPSLSVHFAGLQD